MMRLAPGSPFTGLKNLPPEVMANIEAKYHLNDPMYLQYFHYLKQLAMGDLGPSFKYRDFSVNELLAQALPVSVEIGVYAFSIAVVVGMSLGIYAALRRNTWVDYTLMTVAMIGVIVPSFVKAPILILIFAIYLKWLPAGGWNDGALMNMILPVAALAISYVSSIARITRGAMIEVLNSPYIRTARAKGLSTRAIVLRHALRPAMLPIVSFLGPAFVGIITGAIVIESVFGLPGIGQMFVNGALNRDYGMILGLTIMVGVLAIVFNAILDILYALIDPKIRY
nr:MAG: oligopeptide ABC transporter permease OppB [Lautropia sp.]